MVFGRFFTVFFLVFFIAIKHQINLPYSKISVYRYKYLKLADTWMAGENKQTEVVSQNSDVND